jgi:hypothetical protein
LSSLGTLVSDREETHHMRLSHPSILLAGSLVMFSAMQAAADQLCKPVLSLRDVRISEARSMQRTWTGVLVADASPCSTTSGPFEIEFTRLKETAPDLRFTERFTWTSGRSVVSIDVWWDEWVEDYRIARIASCPCRD